MNPIARVYAFWEGIPPEIREPIRSFAVSAYLGCITAIGTLSSAYFFGPHHSDDPRSWPGFLSYLASPASAGAMCMAIGAIHRARQAKTRVANTVTLDDGTHAIIVQPKAPAAS